MRDGLRTDMDRLRAAFMELRELGYWARISQDGGFSSVPEDIIRRCGKYVFWHANETGFAFDQQGMLKQPLHMRHLIQHENEIRGVLSDFFGKRVTIDRSPRGGVVVHPSDQQIDDDAPDPNFERSYPVVRESPRRSMQQTAMILRELAGGDDGVKTLIDRLQDGEDAQRYRTWAVFLARIRKAAGLPDRVAANEPKELIELIERLEKGATDKCEPPHGS